MKRGVGGSCRAKEHHVVRCFQENHQPPGRNRVKEIERFTPPNYRAQYTPGTNHSMEEDKEKKDTLFIQSRERERECHGATMGEVTMRMMRLCYFR